MIPLIIWPLRAPVQQAAFDLLAVISEALAAAPAGLL